MNVVQSAVIKARDCVLGAVSQTQRATFSLRAFGLRKVPLLLYCRPTVVRLDGQSCTIKIALRRATRNHYGSMYFGALAVGADCAAGLMATHQIELAQCDIALLFKDFHADFISRPTGDTHFTCNDGETIRLLVAEALKTGERVHQTVHVDAVVPTAGPNPVARFSLTLSLKRGRPRAT